MKYTTETPTEPGYYWVKYFDDNIEIEDIVFIQENLKWIHILGNDDDNHINCYLDKENIKWCKVEKPE